MTSDIDLGVDLNELAAEEARSNRPTWNQEPIQWEGDLAVIDMGQDTNEKTGQVFPKHAFHFVKCKFLDVGNASWLEDGNEYTLLISPVSDEQKAKKTSRFTAIGKSTLASGQNLTKFLHQRVRVTEIAETYKSREGYDRQSYHWKFEALGGAMYKDTTIAKDLKFAEAEEAARLALESTAWESESAFRTAWLNNPAVSQLSPDFNTEVMLGRWDVLKEHFKNLGTPAA